MANIYFRNRKNGDLLIHSTESVCREYLHQRRVINRLSRKIQKKNNLIKILDYEKAEFVLRYIKKKERIEKALEYIGDPNDFLSSEEMKYIKEILKGDSNE